MCRGEASASSPTGLLSDYWRMPTPDLRSDARSPWRGTPTRCRTRWNKRASSWTGSSARLLLTRRTNAAAEIHSPLYSPGTRTPAVMRHCGRLAAVSKTVAGRKVRRGFESLPLRFLGLVEPNSPQTRAVRRSAGRLETAAAASTNVSERRRPPPLRGFHSPAFPPGRPGGDANGWSRSCTSNYCRHPGRRRSDFRFLSAMRRSVLGVPRARRSSSEAQLTTTVAPRPRRL